MSNYQRAVILGDIHFPFEDAHALQLATDYIKRTKPDLVVQIGDLVDNHAFSRFYKSMDILPPRAELERAGRKAQRLWLLIRHYVPKAKLVQVLGNHDLERLEKNVLMKAPELHSLVMAEARRYFDFPGVTTLRSYRDSYATQIQGEKVTFHHGKFSTTRAHIIEWNSNMVIGHLHTGELVHGYGKWALNCGYLANQAARVFDYRATTVNKWQVGIGVVDGDGPRFISKRCLTRY